MKSDDTDESKGALRESFILEKVHSSPFCTQAYGTFQTKVSDSSSSTYYTSGWDFTREGNSFCIDLLYKVFWKNLFFVNRLQKFLSGDPTRDSNRLITLSDCLAISSNVVSLSCALLQLVIMSIRTWIMDLGFTHTIRRLFHTPTSPKMCLDDFPVHLNGESLSHLLCMCRDFRERRHLVLADQPADLSLVNSRE